MVYSQPKDTGTGNNIMTQVAYAITYLKQKLTPQRLEDLLSYLSIQHRPSDYLRTITAILRQHEKIEYNPKGFDGAGSYRFRPIHNIRDANQLLGFLQAQTDAKGLPVKELMEGWPDAEAAITALENEHRLLVVRNKKDGHARTVWLDDPSLSQNVDEEFQNLWHGIRLPNAEDTIQKIEELGLSPANKSMTVKATKKAPEKKTKKARKSGKTTNTHMVGILRDYSHLKK